MSNNKAWEKKLYTEIAFVIIDLCTHNATTNSVDTGKWQDRIHKIILKAIADERKRWIEELRGKIQKMEEEVRIVPAKNMLNYNYLLGKIQAFDNVLNVREETR